MTRHKHDWRDAPEWHFEGKRTAECFPCRSLLHIPLALAVCIFPGCVATWEHSHGGFPGGYTDPRDPEGTPIAFVGPDPQPGAVRDYHGAAL